MNYYSNFVELKEELDEKIAESRVKQGKLREKPTYKQLGERMAINYFEENKGRLIKLNLALFIEYMERNIRYTERNGEANHEFKHDNWLHFEDKQGIFLLSEEVQKSFVAKLCKLIKREFIINTPACYEFSVRIINSRMVKGGLKGNLIIFMTLLD